MSIDVWADAAFDFSKPNDQTYQYLSFKTGDRIRVLQNDRADWWLGEFQGKEGFFPANHVQVVAGAVKPEDARRIEELTMRKEQAKQTLSQPNLSAVQQSEAEQVLEQSRRELQTLVDAQLHSKPVSFHVSNSNNPNSSASRGSVTESDASLCHVCGISFGFLNRKRICKLCGMVTCVDCSKKIVLPQIHPHDKHRVCDRCKSTALNPPPRASGSTHLASPSDPRSRQSPTAESRPRQSPNLTGRSPLASSTSPGTIPLGESAGIDKQRNPLQGGSDADNFNARFEAFLEASLFNAQVRAAMRQLDPEKKKFALAQYEKIATVQPAMQANTPEMWVKRLGETLSAQELHHLFVCLSGNGKDWLSAFEQKGGLSSLLDTVADPQGLCKADCVRCIKAFMNNQFGLELVLGNQSYIHLLITGLAVSDDNACIGLLQLLTVVCWVSAQGLNSVVQNFNYLINNKTPYKVITDILRNSENVELLAGALTFVNTMINSSHVLEQRVTIRNSFLANHLDFCISILRKRALANRVQDEHHKLGVQCDLFDSEHELDQRDTLFQQLDLADLDQVFKFIRQGATQEGCEEYLLQIMQQLITIPRNNIVLWKCAAYITESVCSKPYQALLASLQSHNIELTGYAWLKQKLIDQEQRAVFEAQAEHKDLALRYEQQQKELVELREKYSSLSHTLDTTQQQHEAQMTELLNVLKDPSRDAGSGASGPAVWRNLLSSIKKMGKSEGKTQRPEHHEGGLEVVDPALLAEVTSLKAINEALQAENAALKAQIAAAPLPSTISDASLSAEQSSLRPPEAPLGGPEAPPLEGPQAPPFGDAPEAPSAPDFGEVPGAPNAPPGDFGGPDAPGPPGPPDGPPGPPDGPPGPPDGPPGPPDGPPGPPGFASAPAGPVLPPKTFPVSRVKMKPLHWKKIPTSELEGTMWWQLASVTPVFDQDALEARFQAKTLTKKTNEVKAAEKPAKAVAVELIDAKRSYNINIALSRFRVNPETIKEGIMTMDESFLTEEKIGGLLSMVPSTEEIDVVQSYEGTPDSLAKPEQFFLTMATIPRLQVRLELTLFRLKFSSLVEEVEAGLALHEAAQKALRYNPKLKKVLCLILAIGNCMNHGTSNGKVYGISLSSLDKLGGLKAADGSDLLMFVADQAREDADFAEEISMVCKPAMRVESDWLESQVKKIEISVSKLRQDLQQSENRSEGDAFPALMQTFLTTAEKRSKMLSFRSVAAHEESCHLLQHFGEDSDTKVEKLFETFAGFCTNFLAAIDRLRKQEAARAKEKKQEDKAAVAKPKPEPKVEDDNSSLEVSGENVVDNVLSTVQQGNADSIAAHIRERRQRKKGGVN